MHIMKSTPPKNWTIEGKRKVIGLKKSSRSFFARWNTVSWYWPSGQDLLRHHHHQLDPHYHQNKKRPWPGSGQDLPIFPTLSQGLAEEINKCVHDIDGWGKSNIIWQCNIYLSEIVLLLWHNLWRGNICEWRRVGVHLLAAYFLSRSANLKFIAKCY